MVALEMVLSLGAVHFEECRLFFLVGRIYDCMS
jgi:hypothetical protein